MGFPLERNSMRAAPAELRPRPGPRPQTVPPKKRRAKSGGLAKRIALWIAFVLLTGWGAAASWTTLVSWNAEAALREEHEAMRVTLEAKVRNLTRRLVGVAAHQGLESDGVEGRLADIITRQVELENRQAMLTSLAEQAGANVAAIAPAAAEAAAAPVRTGLAESAPSPAATMRTRPPAPAVPTLRLGAPDPAPTVDSGPARAYAPAGQERAPDLLRTQAPDAAAGPGRANDLLRPRSDVPLRERFAELTRSLDRVERGQLRAVEGFTRLSQGQILLLRTALADIGVSPERVFPPAPKAAVGGPFFALRAKAPAPPPVPTDPFEAGWQRLEQSVAQLRPAATALPFRRPIPGDDNTTSNFGPRTDPFTGGSAMHSGMDFRGETGTPVYAAGAGKVITAEASGGYGNLVEIDHGHGVTTRYAHLSAIEVAVGQSVQAGARVGLVGSTGRSTGPHLHYETRNAGTAIDPQKFLAVGSKLSLPQPGR
jgi:murein DD-endopeptidase MepM/ murein hydrolase activator NlpD